MGRLARDEGRAEKEVKKITIVVEAEAQEAAMDELEVAEWKRFFEKKVFKV